MLEEKQFGDKVVRDDKFIWGHVVFEIFITRSSVSAGDNINIWSNESVTQKSNLGWRYDFKTIACRWCLKILE